MGACYDPEPTSGDDDDDDEAFATSFCEESGFTEAECKSYDSPECKCEWEDGSCWYNEGSCGGLPKMKLREVVEEALGISVGNAALVYILTSVICVHALVRALGKCGAVRFRNGRFISPVVLDEYLERRSVDAVLRQEREKETDPFL